MVENKEIYKCEICGNIIEVMHGGPGQLVCCGQPMINIKAKQEDLEKGEKHVPIIELVGEGALIKVGEVEHPMTEEHHIEWIEIHTENEIMRKNFLPEEKPIFECLNLNNKPIKKVRTYCNLHELWETLF